MNRSIKKIIVAHVGARDKYSIAEMFQKKRFIVTAYNRLLATT